MGATSMKWLQVQAAAEKMVELVEWCCLEAVALEDTETMELEKAVRLLKSEARTAVEGFFWVTEPTVQKERQGGAGDEAMPEALESDPVEATEALLESAPLDATAEASLESAVFENTGRAPFETGAVAEVEQPVREALTSAELMGFLIRSSNE